MYRRRYIALAGTALVAGCQSDDGSEPDTETETETPAATETATAEPTATATPTPAPEPSIQVSVDYPDDWSGEIRTTAEGSTGSRAISHRGSQTYDVDPEASALSVEVQKEDTTLREITVQIIRNGEVVAEGSTEDEFGTVELQERFS